MTTRMIAMTKATAAMIITIRHHDVPSSGSASVGSGVGVDVGVGVNVGVGVGEGVGVNVGVRVGVGVAGSAFTTRTPERPSMPIL